MTSSIDEWPQPGDEVLIAQRYQGSRPGGSLKRSRVERLTARDVVLQDGTRFRKHKVSAGQVVVRSNGVWDPPTWGLHPEHPEAVRMRRENTLAKASDQLRHACRQLDLQAAGDYMGGKVTAEAMAQVDHAWRQLMRSRELYGLPAPVAATSDAGQPQDGEHHQDEQDRVDGEAEGDGGDDDQDGDEQVD